MDGVEGKFQAVGNAELVEDIVQVILYGLFADEELFADFLVAVSLRDQLHDFFFAVAEQRLFAARAADSEDFLKRLHDFRGHAIVEPDFAAVNFVDAPHQQVGGGLLQHDAARAQAHRANHVAVIFRGGEHDHARGQLSKFTSSSTAKPIFVRHAQIEQQNVGLELSQHFDAFVPVGSLADDGDFVFAVEQFAQTFTEDGVVVGHQDTNLFCFRLLPYQPRGTSTVKRAPCPGVDSTVNTPPTLRVRSLIEMGPNRSRSNSSPVKRPAKLKPSRYRQPQGQLALILP